jgi:hypothetical protein
MKSIPVPKTSIPPAVTTLVIQITPKEARELLDVCETYHHVMGHKHLASSALIKHLKQFLEIKE